MTAGAGILEELDGVVAAAVNAHEKMVRRRGTWCAADYIPYDLAADYRRRPPQDSDSPFSPDIQIALETAALTEAALPWYTVALYETFGGSEAWMAWLQDFWVPEEDKHSKALSEFISATRALPPQRLEAGRAATLSARYQANGKDPLHAIAYITLQERATWAAHHGTAVAARGQDADAGALFDAISRDENRHMIFNRAAMDGSLELAPSAAVTAICHEIAAFGMPGKGTVPGFGARTDVIAEAGIYDWRTHHRQVTRPLVRHWRVFDRDGLDDEAKRCRDRLWLRMERLDARLAAAGTRPDAKSGQKA